MDYERQQHAPIYEALERFRKKRVVPFDVPGHKRGRGNPELVELLGEKCVSLDVNSMKPLDNLCHPVSVIADAEQIKRVINNIVSNSIKYIDKPKGYINIRVKDVGDFIQVEIEDNGKGIATKDLPLIFNRFYRTDASRNSSKGGSGIGLSIVRLIVPTYITYIFIEILSGAMRGAGDSLIPTIMTLTGVCLLRVFWVTVVVSAHHELNVLLLSYPITWIVTSGMFVVYYLRGRWLKRCIALQNAEN